MKKIKDANAPEKFLFKTDILFMLHIYIFFF